METCWKPETIFNIIRPCSNIGLVSATFAMEDPVTCSEKDWPLNRNFYTKPYFRVSFWEAELAKVAWLPGRILRWGFSTRPGSSRFLAPSVFFRNGQKAKWFQIDEKTHYDIQTERKKEKKRTINFSLISGRCVQQSYCMTVYVYIKSLVVSLVVCEIINKIIFLFLF